MKRFFTSAKITNEKDLLKSCYLKDMLYFLKLGAHELLIEQEFLLKLIKARQNSVPLRIKLGLDPTASDIHLGHVVVLNKLKQFQDLGHQVVFLIGNFTAMIGDPSGRNIVRPQLTDEEIAVHVKTYLTQVSLILDLEKTEICYNADWYNILSSRELIQLTSHYTVARMMERDDFAKRLEKKVAISMHEFLYPLMQGYDSVVIKSDLELGGTDQKFNLLVGRELQKDFGQIPQCILTMPLLEGLCGVEKMSKSKNNYIGITEPASTIFAKIMSISDSMMWRYYELLSICSPSQIADFKVAVAAGKNPIDMKISLAQTLVSRFHSSLAAKNAAINFFKCARGGIPTEIPEISINGAPLSINKLIQKIGLCVSVAEASRMIDQGAVRINNTVIRDKYLKIEAGTNIIQIGKRKFMRVKLL